MDVEATDRSAFAALIHYRHSVEATQTVEEVEQFFHTHTDEYVVVVSQGAVVGMCGRNEHLAASLVQQRELVTKLHPSQSVRRRRLHPKAPATAESRSERLPFVTEVNDTSGVCAGARDRESSASNSKGDHP